MEKNKKCVFIFTSTVTTIHYHVSGSKPRGICAGTISVKKKQGNIIFYRFIVLNKKTVISTHEIICF